MVGELDNDRDFTLVSRKSTAPGVNTLKMQVSWAFRV